MNDSEVHDICVLPNQITGGKAVKNITRKNERTKKRLINKPQIETLMSVESSFRHNRRTNRLYNDIRQVITAVLIKEIK